MDTWMHGLHINYYFLAVFDQKLLFAVCAFGHLCVLSPLPILYCFKGQLRGPGVSGLRKMQYINLLNVVLLTLW